MMTMGKPLSRRKRFRRNFPLSGTQRPPFWQWLVLLGRGYQPRQQLAPSYIHVATAEIQWPWTLKLLSLTAAPVQASHGAGRDKRRWG